LETWEKRWDIRLGTAILEKNQGQIIASVGIRILGGNIKMVGAVIIAHSSIGSQLIATAEYMVGELQGITAVSIDFEKNVFEARKVISQAMKQVDQGDGVLLLTDLWGGSPCNIAFSFLNDEKVEVVTGINLPMILTFWNKRRDSSLQEIAKYVQSSGTRGIARARDLMEARSAFGRGTRRRDKQLSQK
jgi:PTS system mannose-specific IIA component